MEFDTAGNPVIMPGETFTSPNLPLPEDGFSMSDYDRAWRESVDAKLDRILELLQPVVKPKVERPAIYFDEFWQAWPKGKKTGRKKCLEIWKRRGLDGMADLIIADVKQRIDQCAKWKAGYVVNPQTYINGDLWMDEIQTVASVPVEVPKELNALVRFAKKRGIKQPEGKVGEPPHEFRARVVREVAGEGE